MPETYGDLKLRVPDLEDEATGADVPASFREFTDSLDEALTGSAGQLLIAQEGDIAKWVAMKGDATLAADGTMSLAAAVAKALVPVGTILATGRSSAPDGYLLCNGAAVSRTTYKALFEAIGTTYGSGNGSTTFNLPDLRGRVPVGVDGTAGRMSANDELGKSGGEERHKLTEAEMPSHSHGPPPGTSTFIAGLAGGIITSGGGTAILTSAASTAASGGGGSHNNMQPYQIVNYIIKH